MVLYDKKSNFLGIGQNELFMLGYEDIEEFKSYHNDFADLFVNHPGYISKFKNFSWIDYTLHSGVSNKNVILRHKNGTEIEAALNIIEISLISPINEENSVYNIEVNISSLKDDYESIIDSHIQEKDIPQELDKEYNTQEPTNKIVFDDISIEDYKEAEADITTMGPQTEDVFVDETPQSTEDYEPTIKLKIDMSDDDFEKDEEEVEIEKETEDFAQEKEHFLEKPFQNKEESEEDIDFAQIAEDTGMDIKSLAMFIEEFIKDSKDISEDLHFNNDLALSKNKIVELKGIASNLKMKSFVETLDLMFENCDNSEFENYLDIFDTKIKNLEE